MEYCVHFTQLNAEHQFDFPRDFPVRPLSCRVDPTERALIRIRATRWLKWRSHGPCATLGCTSLDPVPPHDPPPTPHRFPKTHLSAPTVDLPLIAASARESTVHVFNYRVYASHWDMNFASHLPRLPIPDVQVCEQALYVVRHPPGGAWCHRAWGYGTSCRNAASLNSHTLYARARHAPGWRDLYTLALNNWLRENISGAPQPRSRTQHSAQAAGRLKPKP
jgi:hypothetical protein